MTERVEEILSWYPSTNRRTLANLRRMLEHGRMSGSAARAALEKAGVPLDTLADRVRHVVQSAFDGHRIVIFSGGAAKETAAVLEENRQTALGGGFGTIMGRNSFQRPHREAIQLLHNVMDVAAQRDGRPPHPVTVHRSHPVTVDSSHDGRLFSP